MYRLYYRFLESRDDYFDYSVMGEAEQGRWKIYGLHLPDEVLSLIYFENAARLLGLPIQKMSLVSDN